MSRRLAWGKCFKTRSEKTTRLLQVLGITACPEFLKKVEYSYISWLGYVE